MNATTHRLLPFGLLMSSLLFMLMTLTVDAAFAAEITVTIVEDTVANDGECSLREAIQSANEDNAVGGCETGSDVDTISFAIPGNGPQIISPTLQLPFITTPIIMDGYTQTGAQSNTNPAPQALNTVLKIVLDGSLIDPKSDGLVIRGGDSTIRGLAINNFDVGIRIETEGSNTIAGNFIGTNISGTVAAANTGNGIAISTGNNIVGDEFGSIPADRNLIAGNGANGVSIVGELASFNSVNRNSIGTTISARSPLRNTASGIEIVDQAANTTVRENVISANGAWGIRIENGATDTTIVGNLIGTNEQGDALGNGEDGILARNSGPQTVGGLYNPNGCCIGNTIAFNQGNGVAIRADLNASLEKGIISNRIYSNTLLGIDLRDDGVTPNDPGDLDGENDANHLQNYPVLTAAKIVTNNITITGTLNTITNTTYTIEFFANDACDPSGYGEGQRLIGRTSAPTDANGNLNFAITFTETVTNVVTAGNQIAATATDIDGNTSEFSQCIPATEEPKLPKLLLPFVRFTEEVQLHRNHLYK